jgi:hypothetical protein
MENVGFQNHNTMLLLYKSQQDVMNIQHQLQQELYQQLQNALIQLRESEENLINERKSHSITKQLVIKNQQDLLVILQHQILQESPKHQS